MTLQKVQINLHSIQFNPKHIQIKIQLYTDDLVQLKFDHIKFITKCHKTG